MDGKYFKLGGKYYYVQSFQFMQGSPDADLGAIVFDVTGLPDSSQVKDVARIRYPSAPGGFHNIFAYKHSDGRVLLFATVNETKALIYDLGKVVSVARLDHVARRRRAQPDAVQADRRGRLPRFLRRLRSRRQAGQVLRRRARRLLGVGRDATQRRPTQMFTMTGLGFDIAHTFTPSPDGRYAVTETEYQYTPLRIWDLGPGQSDSTKNLDLAISAWTADWRDLSHNHEVRWPYVFVSAYEDGFQVFDLKDPKNPEDRRLVLHLRVRARQRLRRHPRQRLAGHEQRRAGRLRHRCPEPRRADRDDRHAERALVVPAGRLQGLERARRTGCRTSRASRTTIAGRSPPHGRRG